MSLHGVEVVAVGETVLTHVHRPSVVCTHVFTLLKLHEERLLAQLTFITVALGVQQLVATNLLRELEGFCTELTCECFLIRMNEHVFFQVSLLFEAFVTLVTLVEGESLGVELGDVTVHGVPTLEPLAAVFTRVVVLVSVNHLHVLLKGKETRSNNIKIYDYHCLSPFFIDFIWS